MLIFSSSFHASKLSLTHDDVISGTSDRKASMTQNITIKSFDLWLEALSIYEALMMNVAGTRYKGLARYQDVIQKANKKFAWISAVYKYHVQFHLSLTLNTPARFNTGYTALYTTILDSFTVRKVDVSCQRCKSPNHLVSDCLFYVKTMLEEKCKKISLRPHPDSSQQTYT